MKKTRQILFFIGTLLLTTIGLTSCDKLTTINVAGPDIEVVLDYNGTRSVTSGSYTLVAQSDTIETEDIGDFIESNQSISDAELRNPRITLSEGKTFAGVDSIQIRYQKAGETDEIVLVTGGVSVNSDTTMVFSDINNTGSTIIDLLNNRVVFKMYAIYDPTVTGFNCFTSGTAYILTASTVLKVNLAELF